MSIIFINKAVLESSSRLRSQSFHFIPSLESLDQRLVCSGCSSGTVAASVVQKPSSGVEATAPVVDSSTNSVNIMTTVTTKSDAVTSIVPQNFNAVSDNPDSIEVQFAGQTMPFALTPTLNATYRLIDGQGTQRPVNPVSYDAGTNTMLMAFTSDLPTGHYTLEAILTGSTTASASTTIDTFGSFDTVSQALPANSLGTIYPQAATPNDNTSSWKNLTKLDPGESVAKQFSIIEGQYYQFQIANQNVSGQLLRLSATGSASSSSVSLDGEFGKSYYLSPGVYEFVATNASKTIQEVAMAVTAEQFSSESLSKSGVVQMSASVGYVSLISGATSSEKQDVDSMTPVSPIIGVTTGLTHGSVGTTNAPVETSGSFSLVALNPSPMGSFTADKPASMSSAPEAPTSTGTMGLKLDRTIMLDPSAASSNPSWFKVPDLTPRIPVDAKLDPEPIAVTDQQLQRTKMVNLTKPPVVKDESPIEISNAHYSEVVFEAIETSARQTSGLVESDVLTQVNSEPSTLPVEFGSISTPAGIVLGACLVYRQIKVAQLNSGLSPWHRPWASFEFGLNNFAWRISKPIGQRFA